jgi:hypothetical protein
MIYVNHFNYFITKSWQELLTLAWLLWFIWFLRAHRPSHSYATVALTQNPVVSRCRHGQGTCGQCQLVCRSG